MAAEKAAEKGLPPAAPPLTTRRSARAPTTRGAGYSNDGSYSGDEGGGGGMGGGHGTRSSRAAAAAAAAAFRLTPGPVVPVANGLIAAVLRVQGRDEGEGEAGVRRGGGAGGSGGDAANAGVGDNNNNNAGDNAGVVATVAAGACVARGRRTPRLRATGSPRRKPIAPFRFHPSRYLPTRPAFVDYGEVAAAAEAAKAEAAKAAAARAGPPPRTGPVKKSKDGLELVDDLGAEALVPLVSLNMGVWYISGGYMGGMCEGGLYLTPPSKPI